MLSNDVSNLSNWFVRWALDKVKLALVGCGTISQLNAPGYLQYDKCDVVALCDPNRERAEYRAKQWGISPKIYTEYSDVLNDSDVQAVELLTPTYLHPQQIIDGLEAGKHVSCQKPISSTLAETDEVAKVVEKSQTKFRITENFFYYHDWRQIQHLSCASRNVYRALGTLNLEELIGRVILPTYHHLRR